MPVNEDNDGGQLDNICQTGATSSQCISTERIDVLAALRSVVAITLAIIDVFKSNFDQ